MKNKKNAFLELVSTMADAEQKAGLADLDHSAKQILLHIALYEERGTRFRVTDLMKAEQFGSTQTIHSRIHALIKSGWLEITPDKIDQRAKHLSLSRWATGRIRQLSTLVTKRARLIA